MLIYAKEFIDNKIQTRAPKGMIYKVENITVTIKTALADNYIFIFSRELPQGTTDSTTSRSNLLGVVSTALTATFEITGVNEKAKVISVAKEQAGSCAAFIMVYGEIVKATRRELILEWIRKKR